MDRSAPNPIPNSWREGEGRRGGNQSKKEERESGDITSNN